MVQHTIGTAGKRWGSCQSMTMPSESTAHRGTATGPKCALGPRRRLRRRLAPSFSITLERVRRSPPEFGTLRLRRWPPCVVNEKKADPSRQHGTYFKSDLRNNKTPEGRTRPVHSRAVCFWGRLKPRRGFSGGQGGIARARRGQYSCLESSDANGGGPRFSMRNIQRRCGPDGSLPGGFVFANIESPPDAALDFGRCVRFQASAARTSRQWLCATLCLLCPLANRGASTCVETALSRTGPQSAHS